MVMPNVKSRFNDWMFKILFFLVPFLFVPLLNGGVDAADLSKAKDIVLSAENFVYNGLSQTPTLTSLNDENGNVIAPSGVTISFKDANGNPVTAPKNAGTYTVVIADGGTSTHSSTNETKTFTITAKPLSDSSITVDTIANQIHDGTAKTPEPVVKDGSTTLDRDTDYTVSYTNNTNVGQATVTIDGMGNYTGTKTVSFNIQVATIDFNEDTVNIVFDGDNDEVTYNTQQQTPNVSVGDDTTTLTKDIDYTVTYARPDPNKKPTDTDSDYWIDMTNSPDFTNAGEIKVTVTPIKTSTKVNPNAQPYDTILTIQPRDIKEMILEFPDIGDQTYTGNEIKVDDHQVKVKKSDGTDTFIEAKDLPSDIVVSYENNTNAGQAKVIITGTKNYTGIIEKTFTIKPDKVILSNLSATKIVYGESLSKSKITGKALFNNQEVEGTFNFVNPNSKPEQEDTKNPKDMDFNAEVTFISKDGNREGTGVVSLKVAYWGEPVENNGIMNWVDKNGMTSTMINGEGISWLKEKSGDLSTWYGIENVVKPDGSLLFKPRSRFHVRWLNKSDSDWDEYYNQIDDKYKKHVDDNKMWVFLMGVTDPDGVEYTQFGLTTNVYIQLGGDWDETDIRGICIISGEDETIPVSYIESSKLAECPVDALLAKLELTHFSAYGVYDPSYNLFESSTNVFDGPSLYKKTGAENKQHACVAMSMFLSILLFMLIYENKKLSNRNLFD
jgi:hypothetical protein